MSEIIEILTAKNVASCVINTAAAVSDITLNALGNEFVDASGGNSKFYRGDSFKILSYGVVVPHLIGFGNFGTLATASYPYLGVFGQRHDNLSLCSLNVLPADGIVIPFANYEMSLGVFENIQANTGLSALPATDFRLMGFFNKVGGSTTIGLSSAGLPAVLNGVTLYLDAFVKIVHNIPLIVW